MTESTTHTEMTAAVTALWRMDCKADMLDNLEVDEMNGEPNRWLMTPDEDSRNSALALYSRIKKLRIGTKIVQRYTWH